MKDNLFTKLAVVLLTVVLAATLSWAEQDTPSKGKQFHGQRARGPERMKNLIAKLNKAVQPTTEQEPQLDQIWKTHRQSMKNWTQEHNKQLKAVRKKIIEAKKSGDKKALNAAQKEAKAIRDSRRELMVNLKQQLSEVLTKEQMKKAKPILARMSQGHRRKGLLEALEKLDLTEQQKAKVKAILNDSAAQRNKTNDKDVKRRFQADAFKKIKQTVLTDEQRKKLKSMRKQARGKRKPRHQRFLKELNLTDEQKAKTKEFMDEARKAAEKVDDPQKRRQIMRVAFKKIREEVWTDEQREKFGKRPNPPSSGEQKKQHHQGKGE